MQMCLVITGPVTYSDTTVNLLIYFVEYYQNFYIYSVVKIDFIRNRSLEYSFVLVIESLNVENVYSSQY